MQFRLWWWYYHKYLARWTNYSKYPSANESTITVTSAIGTTNPRWGKVQDMALLHNITTEQFTLMKGLNYDYTEALHIGGVKLGGVANCLWIC